METHRVVDSAELLKASTETLISSVPGKAAVCAIGLVS
jgi:hypothetical protein